MHWLIIRMEWWSYPLKHALEMNVFNSYKQHGDDDDDVQELDFIEELVHE